MNKTTNAEKPQDTIEAAPKKKVVRSRRKAESKPNATETENSKEETKAAAEDSKQPVVKKSGRKPTLARKQRSLANAKNEKAQEAKLAKAEPVTETAKEMAETKETEEAKEAAPVEMPANDTTESVADDKKDVEIKAETPATDTEANKEKAEDVPTAEVSEPAQKDTDNRPQPKRFQQEQKRNNVVAKPKAIATDIVIRDFCDLVNNGARIPILSDQQIQMLSYEEAVQRCAVLERILRQVLDYDIVLSDTNIWLELQVGHSSSHSDPKVNARLQFERQLESISKMMKRIGGKFMIMSETYEEIDRFASVLDPVNYKEADWNDEVLCRNVAARLAKRLMLAQQKENRLRIEGIGSESHHGAFADPAIIRRTVELFADGKKVLLLTNDTSVGIRSLGMCDDLQRFNKIDDKTWRTVYEPIRPMVLTMDDLKTLDVYSRQYYFLQTAAGRTWMQDVEMREPTVLESPLQLWMDGFRAGDRHERRSDRIEQQRKEQQRKDQQKQEQAQREADRKAELERREQQRRMDKERAARAKAEEAKPTNVQPSPEPEVQDVAVTEPVVENVVETPTAEETPRPSRRGGRGRRSNKPKAEKPA